MVELIIEFLIESLLGFGMAFLILKIVFRRAWKSSDWVFWVYVGYSMTIMISMIITLILI